MLLALICAYWVGAPRVPAPCISAEWVGVRRDELSQKDTRKSFQTRLSLDFPRRLQHLRQSAHNIQKQRVLWRRRIQQVDIPRPIEFFAHQGHYQLTCTIETR
jgi:hypothetical protein